MKGLIDPKPERSFRIDKIAEVIIDRHIVDLRFPDGGVRQQIVIISTGVKRQV